MDMMGAAEPRFEEPDVANGAVRDAQRVAASDPRAGRSDELSLPQDLLLGESA